MESCRMTTDRKTKAAPAHSLPRLSYTRKETAQILGISLQSVDRLCGLGKLKYFKEGKIVRICARSIEALARGEVS